MMSLVRAQQGEPSCGNQKAATNKKDGFYANPPFLLQKIVNKRQQNELLFILKLGQKCCNLELSFCVFSDDVGFELTTSVFLSLFICYNPSKIEGFSYCAFATILTFFLVRFSSDKLKIAAFSFSLIMPLYS